MIARAAISAALLFAFTGCSEPDEPPTVRPWDCGPPEPASVGLAIAHHEMCVGDEQRLSATVDWSCGKAATTVSAEFSSSDPIVISIEGDRAIARATGAAELKASAEGEVSAAILVRVLRCPGVDAGVDGS